jgi:hypothetical protein
LAPASERADGKSRPVVSKAGGSGRFAASNPAGVGTCRPSKALGCCLSRFGRSDWKLFFEHQGEFDFLD